MNISIKREQNNARISSAEREKFGAKLKTKNIFKVLALAMLMPAMLLTTACSNDDEAIVNNETTNKKGYPLQVTVNVSRQGDDATRAEYTDNGNGTGSLAFSTGDKLLVRGNDNSGGGAGSFAGMLDYVSEGTFSGTIYTQNSYSGTADALFTAATANWVGAALFPNGYDTYEFLSLSGSGYNTSYSMSYNKAIAATKAAAVEQFSLETAITYSSGFALSPQNAILNFTITGLTDGEKAVTLKNGSKNMFTGSVTPTSGTAAFALGARLDDPVNLKNVTLTIGGTDIAIISTHKYLEAGKIYNITRSAEDPNAPLSGVFTVQTDPSTITVQFSKGNLQATYNGSAWTWGFAANQWDYIGNAAANTSINGNGTVSSNGTVDLFGWSTAATVLGINNSTGNIYTGDFADWGSNATVQAGIGTGWRTLTSGEWTYLLNTRGGTRYCKATVNSKTGLVIFPDSYSHPAGVTAVASANTTGAAFTTNSWSGEDWTKMETAGAVFLPAAGFRNGTSVIVVGSNGYYWSSTHNGTDNANGLNFSSYSVSSANSSRSYGSSVRLVQDVVTP